MGAGTSLLNLPKEWVPKFTTIALNNAVYYAKPTIHLWTDSNLAGRYSRMSPGKDFEFTVTGPVGAERLLASNPGYPDRDKILIAEKANEGDISRVSADNNALWVVSTVASAAIMLAWKMGARDVYIIGVDGYKIECTHATGHWIAEYFDDNIEPAGKQWFNPCLGKYAMDIDKAIMFIQDVQGPQTNFWTLNPFIQTRQLSYWPLGRLLE